jgi:hypothetical protein
MKIVFAHNVYNRFLTLKDTVQIEKKLFPDSKVSVAYNGDFVNVFGEFNDINFVKFNEKPHKIGCVNGCILSIQQLLKEDFDVLIFSHDDVSIVQTHIDVVNKHINSIISGDFDVVCRTPQVKVWGGYYMMEVFYISKKAAIDVFSNLSTLKNEHDIPLDVWGKIAPETWLHNVLNGRGLKINVIEYELRLDTYNDQLIKLMGFYHKNAGLRGWKD